MESIKGTCSNNQPSGPTFEESFEDAYIMFTHFVKTADDLSMIVLGKSFCKILSSQHNTAITDELECPEPGATFVPTRKQNLLGCPLRPGIVFGAGASMHLEDLTTNGKGND